MLPIAGDWEGLQQLPANELRGNSQRATLATDSPPDRLAAHSFLNRGWGCRSVPAAASQPAQAKFAPKVECIFSDQRIAASPQRIPWIADRRRIPGIGKEFGAEYACKLRQIDLRSAILLMGHDRPPQCPPGPGQDRPIISGMVSRIVMHLLRQAEIDRLADGIASHGIAETITVSPRSLGPLVGSLRHVTQTGIKGGCRQLLRAEQGTQICTPSLRLREWRQYGRGRHRLFGDWASPGRRLGLCRFFALLRADWKDQEKPESNGSAHRSPVPQDADERH